MLENQKTKHQMSPEQFQQIWLHQMQMETRMMRFTTRIMQLDQTLRQHVVSPPLSYATVLSRQRIPRAWTTRAA